MAKLDRFLAALLAALLASGPAPAATYGDVDVTVESEPKGTATHGYGEIWVRVTNRSTSATRSFGSTDASTRLVRPRFWTMRRRV